MAWLQLGDNIHLSNPMVSFLLHSILEHILQDHCKLEHILLLKTNIVSLKHSEIQNYSEYISLLAQDHGAVHITPFCELWAQHVVETI